ncbi:hypothetical protein TNCV_2649331 [Trichonephila clavipes]|nr:hypothetical protein TNCV_2649331 [Trichonephila clavipes]
MGTPTARNVAPAGSEYAETVRSNHCSLATFFGAIKTNPNEHYFLDQHVRNSSALIMVADPIRNPAAEEYVVYLNRCLNQGKADESSIQNNVVIVTNVT